MSTTQYRAIAWMVVIAAAWVALTRLAILFIEAVS